MANPSAVAVVGSGIAGLGAAWHLAQAGAAVTLYEAQPQLGGHAHTRTVTGPAGELAADTGFLVYNTHTYPNFSRLLDHLGVATHESRMSFSVSLDDGALEYNGGSLSGLFAQPANLVRPRHWRMLADVLRFYRDAPAAAAADSDGTRTLGAYLDQAGYSAAFVADHLLPMGAAIWSTSEADMRRFPLHSFVAFCANHGLLQVRNRPPWRTVTGGSRAYVARMAETLPPGSIQLNTPVRRVWRQRDGVYVAAGGPARRFDHVVLAGHTDQSRAILADAGGDEARALARIRYNRSHAVLHRDRGLMPRRRRAWAAWNYLRRRGEPAGVTYWLNALQGLDSRDQLFVSLNPPREPAPNREIARLVYDHPQLDHSAIAAQAQLPNLQGRGGIWFAGAWTGYGFHEDGLAAGLAVAESITGVPRPWACPEESPAAAACRPAPALSA